ncbi:MAG: flagellar hook-associated protein FlgK [Desulfamplus sp.]|nr:flagellar hook-associated protein FlgK [Desulfamplus sp.]
MGGIGSTLQIAKGALAAQQYGLNVTGNNISNVNNPDYSRQSVEQINNGSIKYAGFLFGTGVNSSQVTQSVNQLLENRLTGEKSSLSGFEEAESYIKIISDHFNESSDNSISNVLTEFWNSWNDLSNNPGDDSERLIILENGQELSERFNSAYDYLSQVETEINMKLVNAVDRINNITADIAKLNVDIMGQEQARTSNDKRDQRNALIDELGQLIDIKVFEQTNGSVVVNVNNGLPIVNGESQYKLAVEENKLNWVNSAGVKQDITDQITGGQIGGWLDIRDSVIPKYQADINELSHEVIWAINEQHSQGVGLEYFSNGLTGEYSVDESGWLTSLSYGDKIDHSKDLTMWIEDKTTAESQYSKIEMDMGISNAKITNWEAGANLTDVTTEPSIYKFTVMESSEIGYNLATITDGTRIGSVQSSASGTVAQLMQSDTLSPIAAQTITILGGESGTTQQIDIKYGGGDAKQSAASIAESLNKIDGVTAHASENSAILDVAGFTANDNDEISFGIYVDGVTHYEQFTVSSTLGGAQEQFEDELLDAVKAINSIYGDDDLTLTWDIQDTSATRTQFTLTSKSGRTIGLENVTVNGGGGSTINFSGDAVGAGDAAAVASKLTIEVEKGITISSSVSGADGGIFAGTDATIDNSIVPHDEAIIAWEQYDTNGVSTGIKGLINVGVIEDTQPISLMDSDGNELLIFNMTEGSLVAGNTMSINVNLINDPASPSYDPLLPTEAKPDPLEFTINGTAKSQNEIYQFKIISGGTIGVLPDTVSGEVPITIEWNNGTSSGTFEIKESDPPMTPDVPYNVEVDGMTLRFTNGTLFKNDVFTITTDESGKPISKDQNGKATGELLSDWHWTLDSFKNQFNRDGQGMNATINEKNELELSTSQDYHVISSISYSDNSEKNGFTNENISVDVKDWGAIDFQVQNLKFIRGTDGVWRVENYPNSLSPTLLPDEGSDDGFGVDFDLDGLADVEFSFKKKITGDGVNEDYFAFDIVKHDSTDIGFSFSDESGTMAALGFNTFFKGEDALSMGLNEVIKDTNFIAAATIDSETGEIYKGDNSNTLVLADIQFESLSMKQWSFTRGKEAETSMTSATLNGYYSTMLGSLGVDAKNIQTSKEFSTLMVNYITEQRDSISAVSLDEEMIKLMEYQHAFTAASKLVKTADEMLNTIIGLR